MKKSHIIRVGYGCIELQIDPHIDMSICLHNRNDGITMATKPINQ